MSFLLRSWEVGGGSLCRRTLELRQHHSVGDNGARGLLVASFQGKITGFVDDPLCVFLQRELIIYYKTRGGIQARNIDFTCVCLFV